MFEANLNVLLIWFTIYYFIECLLRVLLQRWNTHFYTFLKKSRKDAVFFGIGMGMLISIVSTPYCASALYEEVSIATTIPKEAVDWNLTSNARVCATARGILWVSELNRLDMYPLYVIHHAGSLISLFSWLYLKWPNAIYLTIFTGLVSEIPGDLVWMVSAYEELEQVKNATFRRMKRRLVRFNMWQYAIVRGSTVLLAIAFFYGNIDGWLKGRLVGQLYGYSLVASYAIFC